MKYTIYLFVVTAIIFVACNNNAEQSNSERESKEMEHAEHKHSSTESEVQKDVNANVIIDTYLQLKNALVADNEKEAAEAGKIMLAAFSNFDMVSLTEEQHKQYMEIANDAKEHAEHIMTSEIGHQREHFEILSIDVKDLISLIGTDKKLYQDFCPMYNDGKGAIWISEIKEVKNPFYGSEMLNCGEMQKEIN